MIDSSGNIGEVHDAGTGRSEPERLLKETEQQAGLRMIDILTLPDPLRETVTWMMRKREVALADLAARLGEDEGAAERTLAGLVELGYLWETRVSGETRYRLRLAPQRRRSSSMLDI